MFPSISLILEDFHPPLQNIFDTRIFRHICSVRQISEVMLSGNLTKKFYIDNFQIFNNYFSYITFDVCNKTLGVSNRNLKCHERRSKLRKVGGE